MWLELVVRLKRKRSWAGDRNGSAAQGREIAKNVKTRLAAIHGSSSSVAVFQNESKGKYAQSQHHQEFQDLFSDMVVASYGSQFHASEIYWMEDSHTGDEAGFFIILEPRGTPSEVHSMAVKLEKEIQQAIGSDYEVSSHRLRIEGVDHYFTLHQPQAPFLTPDGQAALIIVAVLAILMWGLFKYASPAPGTKVEQIYQSALGLLLGVLANCLCTLAIMAYTWRQRVRAAKLQRKVVYSDGE